MQQCSFFGENNKIYLPLPLWLILVPGWLASIFARLVGAIIHQRIVPLLYIGRSIVFAGHNHLYWQLLLRRILADQNDRGGSS